MKTKYHFFLVSMIITSSIFAQTGNITPYIDGTFIQGISPVVNTFTVTDYPVGTETVVFYCLDENDMELLYFEDYDSVDGFEATFDMGQLLPYSYLYVEYYDIDDYFLDFQCDCFFGRSNTKCDS